MGQFRIAWTMLAIVAAVAGLIGVINATSNIIEAEANGAPFDPREYWVLELSSIVFVVGLAPLIAWVVTRVAPPKAGGAAAWARFVGLHLLAGTAFSLIHIAGMVAVRKLAYASAGATYDFAYGGDFGLPFLYEWRKDLLTYTAIAFAFWAWGVFRTMSAKPAPAAAAVDTRIEVRDGARTLLIDPASISWVEAAGNYVELNVGAGRHLVRGTLASFEEKLGAGFVRVHRSRLVNRAKVTAFKPTPSGDLELTLDDGRTLVASRRFRAAIES